MDYNRLLLTTDRIYDYIQTKYDLTRTLYNVLYIISQMTVEQDKTYLINYFQTTDTSIRQYFYILSKKKYIVSKSTSGKERGLYTVTMRGKKVIQDVDIFADTQLRSILF